MKIRRHLDSFWDRLSRGLFAPVKGLLILAVAILATLSYKSDFVTRHEAASLDWQMWIRGARPISPRIVIVEIDRKTADRLGRPPLEDASYAKLVRALSRFGAKAIAFNDIVADEPPSQSDFAEAVRRAGNVYLACDLAGDRKAPSRSYPLLRKAAKGEGHRHIQPDPDGVVRSIPFDLMIEGEGTVPIGAVMAFDIWGVGQSAVQREPDALVVSLPNDRDLSVPIRGGNLAINWPARWAESFKRVSFVDVLSVYDALGRGETVEMDTEIFKDSACLVGVTIAGMHESFTTPLEPNYPAVGVQAVVLNTFLNRSFLKYADDWISLSALWVLCAVIFFVFFAASFLRSLVRILIAAISYTVLAVTLFLSIGVVIPIMYPLIVLAAAFIVLTACHQIVSVYEERRLMKLVTKDSLTGIFNYRHFRLLLDNEIKDIEMRKNKDLSILTIDIDHFKRINDKYGHAAGDEVIRGLAHILRNNCRSLDVACRYGGEEFLLMLPGAATEDAGRIAERIRKSFSDHKFYLGETKEKVQATISMGLAAHFAKESVEDLLRRSDRALYKAKEAGRNMICRA